jgi:uncharacterized protein (TIGR03118 family)
LSSALLVGNFGDGRINAYDPSTGAPLGTLSNPGGTPITIGGLWGLQFGNGINNQPTNTLFFSAGPVGESHGLYGRIDTAPVPEPSGTLLAIAGSCFVGLRRVRRTSRAA